ncbi:hypothetical protein MKW98_016271 [Papaver atlanticum]|uniref:Uncoupling protein 3 n=1 Tax=Papaver atlanticum TaxID=357466 RepID=A0AAD4SGT3_9MAGN|nr:hypothetical protein MKW98_016271 [Papaver atlanticum]
MKGDEEEKNKKKLFLTSISAVIAETSTFPLDITKTRLQLYSHGGGKTDRSSSITAFKVASEIVRNEGLMGMYRGLSASVCRHLFYTPIRIVGYEHLRNSFGGNDSSPLSLPKKAFLGGISGVIAQVLASPADLVKVRMQADGRLMMQGLQPRYTGIFNALNTIVKTEGIGGLWRGVVPNVQRAFLVNMGELACYDHAKRFVIGKQVCDDNIYAHTLASTMSGLAATALSCPADVVKTRVMNQAAGNEANKTMYKNSYDCLVKTVRVEGVMALWKGFFPTWARLGPWQFVFWVSYERLRNIAGLSSF